MLCVALFFLAANVGFSADSQQKVFGDRAEAEFHRAQKQFQSNAGDFTNAWEFARACFDFADFSTNSSRRGEIAKQGISACQIVIARQPKWVQGHYYLAMNFGQLAEAEQPSIAAYKLIKEIEREFKMALELDEHFDFAGPDRGLGLLYRDAPGWPISIGSKHKARENLERAASISADYPENILNLVESYVKWGETKNAKTELKILDALWPQAQKKLAGEYWERSWSDWTKRRDVARQKLAKAN